jgi:hypothetical protein
MDKNIFEIVEKLLEQWKQLLKINARNSLEKASQIKGGLKKRVKLEGKVIIFDYPTIKVQKQIQNQLIKLLPEQESLILSEPAILDFDWKVEDYLELYANHYILVVNKLLEIIEKSKCQLNNI